ncbi:MAG: hypothetical protein IJA29_09395 [Lachnospiraceae bacterium]|nr:hypothetical protein [Lachnospiraceae bacterium]
MSNKTKIVVLHMKEIIYSAIFALLGILFIVLLIIMFVPDKQEETAPELPAPTVSEHKYIPGIYSTTVSLGSQTLDIEVMVDADTITSIELVNLSEDVETMFPLIKPSFDDLTTQIINTQSINNITYPSDAKYTSLVILEAIEVSLNKAKTENLPAEPET